MNEIKILEWIVKGKLHTDDMGIFWVTEDEALDTCKSAVLIGAQFGGTLMGKLVPGTYFYMFAHRYFEDDLKDLNKKEVFPQAVILRNEETILLYLLRRLE